MTARELRRPLLAGCTLAVASWAFVSFTPVFRDWLFGDARYLENWGNWMSSHQVPYRDFHVEYPPGALPTFVLPVYLKKLFDYQGTYYFWLRVEILVFALLALAAMAWALRSLGASRRRAYAALCLAGVAPAVLGPIAFFHYDMWPALLAVTAVAALLAGRGVLACALLALGAAAKVFPIVLLPIALVELWRCGRWRAVGAGIAAAAAVLAVTIGPFAIVAPHGVGWAIHREANRPLEIETIGAGFFTLAHAIGGLHVHEVASAGSHNLVGPGPHAVKTLLSVLSVLALVSVYALHARARPSREAIALSCATATTAYVVFATVFSPQYLVWLVPLVPLVAGRRGLRASAVLVATLAATQIFEPYRQLQYWQLEPWTIVAVFVRNLLVVALLAVLVWPDVRTARLRVPGRP